ncbi:MAG: glycosyltransferase family 2 protein [Tannerella sp.]|nr:glycosyltransferase family 2 protein [Tannerella sp.]
MEKQQSAGKPFRSDWRMVVITPVKDSIVSALETAKAIVASSIRIPCTYIVYNDFSTAENTRRLEEAAAACGFTLINLSEHTNHPSPNYLWILQDAQQKALDGEAALCIVESDVVVQPDTLQSLFDGALGRPDCGIAAAVTVDGHGEINYPYLYARKKPGCVFSVRKHVSFCCSLLTHAFLRKYDFIQLNPARSWHDVVISRRSLALGFRNYLFTTLPVVHKPHGSRPWKQLKYTNPLRYYWRKFVCGRDRI